MQNIEDFNWDSLYRQTQAWMDRERIPGKVDTGCRSIRSGCPVVDIRVPCRGNKAIIERVCNYRHVYRFGGYIAGGVRYYILGIRFTENGEMDNG
ncbi:hypothetical protein BLCOC_38220 [Blautia coccoides]|uniref:Uncharacterized protein n=1 Tax=Blautia producta TaxID=33035 RepID=A0ABZ0UDY5_9FIRM|nr:hypothetical protein EV205_101118 [Blautia coccoides]WPX75460.1 hypothetical protein BLCOC_38220 [Blautia coccoides]SUX98659.1 Uncharacterised protein [Blautia coccoides]